MGLVMLEFDLKVYSIRVGTCWDPARNMDQSSHIATVSREVNVDIDRTSIVFLSLLCPWLMHPQAKYWLVRRFRSVVITFTRF